MAGGVGSGLGPGELLIPIWFLFNDSYSQSLFSLFSSEILLSWSSLGAFVLYTPVFFFLVRSFLDEDWKEV